MSSLIDRLRAAGADMDGAMDRMLQDEELYASCFTMFMSDPAFDELTAALDAKDYERAFDAAHSLKGVSANLGLTNMFHLVEALVEPLRYKMPDSADLKALCASVLSERDSLKTLLG